MSVKQKLQVGFGIILIFLFITSGLGMYYLHNSNQTMKDIATQQQMVAHYNDIAFHTVRANAAIRGYMLYEKPEMRENHYEIRQQLAESIQKLEQAGINNTDFNTFLEKLHTWETAIDTEIFPLLDANEKQQAQAIAAPVLGQGSQELVVFGKTMATELTKHTEKEIAGTVNNGTSQLIQMVIFVVIAIVVSFIISTLFGRHVTKNIRETMEKITDFANGNFLARLETTSTDEFGQLAATFNHMTDTLRDTMRQVGNSSEQVAATAEQLTASSNEVSFATEIVTESIQDISSGIESQTMLTKEVNDLSAGILHRMNDITGSIGQVNESTYATKELADAGTTSVRNVIEQMTIIANNTNSLTKKLNDLNDHTDTIVNAVNTIKEIADQTNLLAINASIEAARSGEHGKGFAVVAEEVRKLAEQSNRAAIEIEHIVTTITTDTERIVEEVVANDQSVEVGRTRVEAASDAFMHIHNAIEDVQSQTASVTYAVQQINQDIENLVTHIEKINDVSTSSNDNVQSVAASSEQQSASMEEVAAASSHLAQMAIELQETIQGFKY